MGEVLQFPGNFKKSPQQVMAEELANRMGCEIAWVALEGGPVRNHNQAILDRIHGVPAFTGTYTGEDRSPSISSLFEPIIDMPSDCPA